MHETMSDAADCRKSQKRRDADERQSLLLQLRSLDCHRGCCHVPRRYIPTTIFYTNVSLFSIPTTQILPDLSSDGIIRPGRSSPPERKTFPQTRSFEKHVRFFFIHEEARVHLLLSSSSLWLHSSIFLRKLYHP
jgi:hypothetical protein